MRSTSSIIVAAAIVLAAFISNCKQPAAPAAVMPPTTEGATASVGHKIGYVNIDTLYENYTWFKTQKAALEQKATNAQKTLRNKEEAFMVKVQAFQEKAQSGNVPPIELEKEQSRLGAEEQALQKELSRMAQNLDDEQAKANETLLASLENKLKEIRTQIGYDYILGYQRGNPTILLANEQLDVTAQVLALLNAQEAAK